MSRVSPSPSVRVIGSGRCPSSGMGWSSGPTKKREIPRTHYEAPEGRQMISLGREPQGTTVPTKEDEPRSGGETRSTRRESRTLRAGSVAPPGLSRIFQCEILGLTPQAIYLSPLRGS